jgi:DNA primase
MSVVDEVKARLDIVDVVSQTVRLQKAGRSFKGLCPFHSEKTPSFIVNPDRQTWHCFGACGTGGDVFSFIARRENLDFAGALRLLAERAGVTLERDGGRHTENRTLLEANEAAAIYYHDLLVQEGPGAAAALRYADERGLDRGVIDDFLLGYSPAGWDHLRDHLRARGFSDDRLVAAGLLVEGERGPYDRFRDRLVFPVRDERGRVVGFGARQLPGRPEEGAKYVNTPQTPLFEKGSILYGLDRARDEIRRGGRAVVVEGYMDVIAAHQHGFRDVVASMGTALTEKQALLLQRFAGNVVLAMDADEAGNAASLRGVQVVSEAAAKATALRASGGLRRPPLEVRVAALPQGVDPDDLIRRDPGAWEQLLGAARPVIDHLLATATAGRDLSQPRARSELAADVLPAIGEVSDPVLQAHYLQRLARLARVSEAALRDEMRQRRPRPRRGAPSSGGETAPAGPSRPRREEFCLALLYRGPRLERLPEGLGEELFTLSENRELFRRWLAGEEVEEGDPALWEPFQRLTEVRLPAYETAQAEAALLDCVARLEADRIRTVKEASALALAEGEAGVPPGEVASIARARWEAGRAEGTAEDAATAVASLLLEDTEVGLRLHRRLIEDSRPDQSRKHSSS